MRVNANARARACVCMCVCSDGNGNGNGDQHWNQFTGAPQKQRMCGEGYLRENTSVNASANVAMAVNIRG